MDFMEKFKAEFSIPFFMAALGKRDTVSKLLPSNYGKAELNKESLSPELKFSIIAGGVLPAPLFKETDKYLISVMGSPIVDTVINREAVLNLFAAEGVPSDSKIASINGEFLIFLFDKQSGTLSIVNDRFTSIPFYYGQSEGVFYGTPYFSTIWDLLKEKGDLKVSSEAIFEFLWLQRILGTKTYAENVKYLQDASVMEIKDGRIAIRRYWTRNYEKSHLSLKKHAEILAGLMIESVRQKSSDSPRLGHFLSGGMDSRSVLASFRDTVPTCFTTALGENNEYLTAKKIAETKGAPHVGLELEDDHYSQIFRASASIIGGMYNFDHGLFLGFADTVKKHADVCFHGHGFDYMFQGMYIPGHSHSFMGRKTYFRTIAELPEDLAGYYIANAPYRNTKQTDIWNFIKPEMKEHLKSFQRDSVSEIINIGKQWTSDPYDLWEYLSFHHISRHYSYPNHASIATYAEQRTVSFDNRIFDFYLSLPLEQRFYGKIEKAALKILDPALAALPSANTKFPVTASRTEQTFYQLSGYVKRRIFPEKEIPRWQERTWPSREHALRNQKELKDSVMSICAGGATGLDRILDGAQIGTAVPAFLEGENKGKAGADFVQALLTAGTFLKR